MTNETMFNAYVECALWASIDDDQEPMDNGEYDLAPETLKQMEDDCDGFLAYCEEENILLPEDDSMNGHDFWLTRNGHGAGFWDRGYDNGKELSDNAETFGSCDLYVGDDGLVYC